jgi:Tat protein secretion system quality control protein TatD with DNase activity
VRRQCNADLLWEVAQGFTANQRSRDKTAFSEDGTLPLVSCSLFPDPLVGVWHAFSGDLAEAQAAYDLGLALGLGGPVTFQNARGLHALTAQLRLDRLLLETDAPYLTPHPHRGQRNEPAYIPLIAAKLAGLFNTTVESVCVQTTVTARRLFEKIAQCDQA